MLSNMKWIATAVLLMLGGPFSALAQPIQLKCNNNSIPVHEQNDVPLSYGLTTYKYARVTYTGKSLNLELTVTGFEFSNTDWDISPHSYEIAGTKKGNTLSFSLNRTGYVVVRFKKDQDFTKRIVIFVEPPEETSDPEWVNIVDTYQVDNSGATNQTEKIQRALNEISGSGKVLYFPPGTYTTFSIQIKSNSRIHLAVEARIIADPSDIESYLATDPSGINRFIWMNDAENVHVSGLGILDGNGSTILGVNDPELVKKLDGMRLLLMINSRNISFEGIVLKDPARWNTHIIGSEDIIFRNCKMMNNMINNEYFGSLDGWDPDASRRVLIENCFCWAGDDNVAIKCTGAGKLGIYEDVEDVTVRGCVFLTKKSALKIGTETRCENYKRIVFEDNDIIEADRVMGINVRDRATVDGVLFLNNRSEYSYPDRREMAINIYITRREDDQPWTGKIKNVVIKDCTFEQQFPKKIQISRIESHTEPGDIEVTFTNLTIANKQVSFLDPTYFELKKCNGRVVFN